MTEPRADFFRAPAFVFGKLVEALELVRRVHVGAGNVFVQADFGGIVFGIEPATNGFGLLDLLALGAQQLRLPAAFASGDEIEAGRRSVLVRLGFDDEVLDHPLMLDAGGQRLNGGVPVRHLAGVPGRLFELVQRHEDFNATDGFGLVDVGHGLHSLGLGFRAAGAPR